MTEQKWVRSSLRSLSERLRQAGHSVSAPTVSRLLKAHDYSLRVNAKEKDPRSQHPDRDSQFRYIATQKQHFMASGDPIISVDTKKKELLGDFKNAGQAWRQEAETVNVHDFLSDSLGRVSPYGVYRCAAQRRRRLRGRVGRHARVRGGSDLALVARPRVPGLSARHPPVDLGGWRRQ